MAKDGRKAATRAAILDVALEQFAKYGFTHATTKAIADQANVSNSTVIYHYGTKVTLYAAATALAVDRFLSVIPHESTRSFRAVAQHWIEHLLDESNGYRLLCWLDDHRHPDIRATVRSVRDRLEDAWRDWLGERAGMHWPQAKRSEVATLIVAAIIGVTAVASHQRQEAWAALERLEPLIEADGRSQAFSLQGRSAVSERRQRHENRCLPATLLAPTPNPPRAGWVFPCVIGRRDASLMTLACRRLEAFARARRRDPLPLRRAFEGHTSHRAKERNALLSDSRRRGGLAHAPFG